MTDKLIMVTSPDDILLDGIRIAIVDLTPEQNNIVSTSLTDLHTIPCVITYIWQEQEEVSWLLDKLQKCQLIIFNAESPNQTLVGYLAAKSNSYYFGTLKSLNQVNNSAIYDVDQCKTILTNTFNRYGT